jgi:Uma2 family endonuclease
MTYADFRALPEDGQRWELIEGELTVGPAPNVKHQSVSMWLSYHLTRQIQVTGRGRVFAAPTDVWFSETTVLEPDLVVVLAGGRARVEAACIQGPPDLVVEILSPSTRRRDVGVKAALYARFGVPEYWVVDPEDDRVEVHVLDGAAYRLETRVSAPAVLEAATIADVSVDLGEVFAD